MIEELIANNLLINLLINYLCSYLYHCLKNQKVQKISVETI